MGGALSIDKGIEKGTPPVLEMDLNLIKDLRTDDQVVQDIFYKFQIYFDNLKKLYQTSPLVNGLQVMTFAHLNELKVIQVNIIQLYIELMIIL